MNLKKNVLKIIKRIPNNSLRISLLRVLFKYSIGENVTIGKSIINCKNVKIGDNVYIADKNVFSCNELVVGDNTKIHFNNKFIGSTSIKIGSDSRIINNHYFDLWNSINIGNGTWIAGKESEFWTHGSTNTMNSEKSLSIEIGDNIYIGSRCLFAPGVKINSNNLIGLGSVITGNFQFSNTIIFGNPAKVVKKNVDWSKNW